MTRQGEEAPNKLSDYRDRHAGETIVVCGCGRSLSALVAPHRFVTIGVNDVGRMFQPDYLVVLNAKHQFAGDRFRYVEESRAKAVFSQLPLRLQQAPVIPIRLGRRGGVEDGDPNVLHFTRNSPYLAVCLAMHMGASRIGLVGVDFTEHHFFAQSGRHPLTAELSQMDREYQRLAAECGRRGIEIYNLSATGRLTSLPKMEPKQFAIEGLAETEGPALAGRRVFFVHYRFQTCGDVFREGLEPAARDLGVEFQASEWNDPALERKVEEFAPELLFVVHGRKFQQRWRALLAQYNSAVWLLDEPYEVDDTSRYSSHYRTVFVNDIETIDRHRNAHYLPVCYNPYESSYRAGPRRYRVGFIGDADPARERLLAPLAERGLLSYVAGGPWRSQALRAITLAERIPASQATALYRETDIVLNIFRTKHPFNQRRVGGSSLNPRIYEAAASGALPLSEWRPELDVIWHGAPSFRDSDSLERTLRELLDNAARVEELTASAVRAFRSHTYAQRLSTALSIALEPKPERSKRLRRCINTLSTQVESVPMRIEPIAIFPGWQCHASVARQEPDGTVLIEKREDDAPGSEEGLIGTDLFQDISLSFEAWLEPGAKFLAKIHLKQQTDQSSNSYHLYVTEDGAMLARHHQVLRRCTFEYARWVPVKMLYAKGRLMIRIDEQAWSIADVTLPSGFCFLGLKGGRARLRAIELAAGTPEQIAATKNAGPAYKVLARTTHRDEQPLLSIITTVYDRVQCLDSCLRSVKGLTYRNFEHLVLADAPNPEVLEELARVVESHPTANNRVFASLTKRQNDWGIAPASAGLGMAAGKYVAFLSDDNGYLPGHFEPLLQMLEREPELGFAYSSCMYAGRFVLRRPRPCAGGIDLGQPIFRKEVLDLHLGGELPFTEAAWDWRLIERLMRAGVRYRHLDRASFIFRLHQYPDLLEALP